jgi:Fic family protein
MPGKADSLKKEDILQWAEYFLLGLKNEIEKIDSLLSRKYVREKILLPAISFALDRENMTEREFKILKYLLTKDDMVIKSEELERFGITNSVQKSRLITKLRGKKIIQPIKKGGRIYTINFVNSYLLR